MRRGIPVILCLCLVLALAACGSGDPAPTASASPSPSVSMSPSPSPSPSPSVDSSVVHNDIGQPIGNVIQRLGYDYTTTGFEGTLLFQFPADPQVSYGVDYTENVTGTEVITYLFVTGNKPIFTADGLWAYMTYEEIAAQVALHEGAWVTDLGYSALEAGYYCTAVLNGYSYNYTWYEGDGTVPADMVRISPYTGSEGEEGSPPPSGTILSEGQIITFLRQHFNASERGLHFEVLDREWVENREYYYVRMFRDVYAEETGGTQTETVLFFFITVDGSAAYEGMYEDGNPVIYSDQNILAS